MLKKRLNYYIVDDSPEFLTAIQLFVENEMNGNIVGTALDGDEAINDDNIYLADIILMDIMMKRVDGMTATKKITAIHRRPRVLAVTNSRGYVTKQALICSGFSGCVYKNQAFMDIPQAIARINEGRLFFSDGILIE